MKLRQYQVAAFANKPFEGNPAAVCPLDQWLDDELMQSIAAENNLAETAFFVAEADGYHIRWFTPTVEVKLCGHATLASAFVLFNELAYQAAEIHFNSLSGPLSVRKKGELFELNFPSEKPQACDPPEGLESALGCELEACYLKEDYVVKVANEKVLTDLQPDFAALKKIDARGVIVTAKSEHYDFVNRFFGPQVGIDEDPVTGSAFTKLTPLWAEQMGQSKFFAKQVSARGGEVHCEFVGDRVLIAGGGQLFMKGEIYI